jgi:hypothetical protein
MRSTYAAVALGLMAAWGTIYAMETSAAAPTGGPLDIVQVLHGYGLAGLAGLLIWAQWRSHERMAAALDRHESLLIELVRENARVAEKAAKLGDDLCQRLDKRPCLRGRDDDGK